MKLNNISRAAGSSQSRTRVGRGVGSGIGGTSGRGHKGQRSRTGGNKGLFGFEGGQTPFWRRTPKTGFSNKDFELHLEPINVGLVQTLIDKKKLDPNQVITLKHLVEVGAVTRHIKGGVKLLGDGDITTKLFDIQVTRASKSAIEKIEQVGGRITTTWYNRLGLRALLKPHKFDIIPQRASPPSRYLPYYTSDEHRGYLSPLLQRRNKIEELSQPQEQQQGPDSSQSSSTSTSPA
jgi:large subunit ribosomal protein L15